MLKYIAIPVFFAATTMSAQPTEDCYRISKRRASFSRTPELLCVTYRAFSGPESKAKISFKTGMPGIDEQTVGEFFLDYTEAARERFSNRNVFAVANPSNSIFNDFQIKFSGFREDDGRESGIVWIGAKKYYYEKVI